MKIEPIVDIKKWRSTRLVSYAWDSETRARIILAADKLIPETQVMDRAYALLSVITSRYKYIPVIDHKGFKVSRIMAYKVGKYTHFYNMPLEQTLLQKVYYFFKNLWLGA